MDKDIVKRFEELESRLKELEKAKKDNLSLFGKSYSQIGTTSADMLIKTRGLVKIQWGNKFIDLLKNGKINVDSEFIYQIPTLGEIGTKDGFYVLEDESVYLVIEGKPIPIVGEVGTTYVSFLEPQETTPEAKYQALLNIGFIYKDQTDLLQKGVLQNGIVYIEDTKKLYTIINGQLSEYTIEIPNPFPKLFVIAKTDLSIGALVINGLGINNSLAFLGMKIYSDNSEQVISAVGNLSLEADTITLSTRNLKYSGELELTAIYSVSDPDNPGGFKLYEEDGKSYLEVDKVIERDKIGNLEPPETWLTYSELILNIDFTSYTPSGGQPQNALEITFYKKHEFKKDDILRGYKIITEDGETNITHFDFTVLSEKVEAPKDDTTNEGDTTGEEDSSEASYPPELKILVNIPADFIEDSEDNNEELDVSYLLNTKLYLIGRSNYYPIAITENLIEVPKNDTEKLAQFGPISKDNNINSSGEDIYGLYIQDMLAKNIYISEDINPTENSSKVATTKWINSILPKYSIILYDRAKVIPNGWLLCDGTLGTPNLLDKALIAEVNGLNEEYVYIIKII